jgi:hypothetical protein
VSRIAYERSPFLELLPKQRPFDGVRVYGEGGVIRVVPDELVPRDRIYALPGPNRAERRGRIEANDGSGFNGTPRALRVTWKRGG